MNECRERDKITNRWQRARISFGKQTADIEHKRREDSCPATPWEGEGAEASLKAYRRVMAREAEREAETRPWRPLLVRRWIFVSGLGSHQRSLRGKPYGQCCSYKHPHCCMSCALDWLDRGQGERHWGTGPGIHARGEEVRSNFHVRLFFYNSFDLICL